MKQLFFHFVGFYFAICSSFCSENTTKPVKKPTLNKSFSQIMPIQLLNDIVRGIEIKIKNAS